MGDAMEKGVDKRQPVKVEVVREGALIVHADSAYIHAGTVDSGCVAIYIDMRSKRGEVIGFGLDADETPALDLSAVDGSLYLDQAKDRDALTCIALPEFKGWWPFAAHISKYTVAVCLVKTL